MESGLMPIELTHFKQFDFLWSTTFYNPMQISINISSSKTRYITSTPIVCYLKVISVLVRKYCMCFPAKMNSWRSFPNLKEYHFPSFISLTIAYNLWHWSSIIIFFSIVNFCSKTCQQSIWLDASSKLPDVFSINILVQLFQVFRFFWVSSKLPHV